MSQELLRGPADRRPTTWAAVAGFFLCFPTAELERWGTFDDGERENVAEVH